MDMRIIEETGDLTHIGLSGELDSAGHHDISTRFIGYVTARMKPTIIDMSGVTFIASVGMGMLANTNREMKDHGVGLALLNPTEAVEKALTQMAWQKVMPITHTRTEALQALGIEGE